MHCLGWRIFKCDNCKCWQFLWHFAELLGGVFILTINVCNLCSSLALGISLRKRSCWPERCVQVAHEREEGDSVHAHKGGMARSLPKGFCQHCPQTRDRIPFREGTLVSLEWLNSRKRLSKYSKYQGTRMWPPSEAGILDVTDPAVPLPPGPYQPLLGGGASGKPGLGAAIPGVRGALRPESQAPAHHLQLPPSSRTSQMDSSSMPCWRRLWDKECQFHSARRETRTVFPAPAGCHSEQITKACQRAPRSEATRGKGRARLSISPHTASAAASPSQHQYVPCPYTEQKPWSHQWLPTSHHSVNPVCSISDVLICPESHFCLPPLSPPGPATIASRLDNHSCLFAGLAASTFAHNSASGDPVKTKPAHIPLLLRAPPVAPAYPTGNAKVFAVAQGSPLYVGLYNPYMCVCFSLWKRIKVNRK